MEHQKIKELLEGQQVEGCYARKDSSLRETRKGGQYIRLTLGDASGSIAANAWSKTEDKYIDIAEQYQDIANVEVLKVRGVVESYQGTLQVKIIRLRPAEEGEADLSELIVQTPCEVDQLTLELQQYIAGVEDPDYSALLHLFFDDEEFLKRFQGAPAARGNHHAYAGGLLEHTISLLKICEQYCKLTPQLNRDLLITGAIFHDLGKVEEMQAGVTIEYTDEGSLMGHLIQGVLMIEDRLASLLDFPREKRALIYHLILSHHGRYEYGSPVLPKTPEALALHHIDNLDAKVYAANSMIANDTNLGSNWTERSWMLETNIYKG
ncbi:MAG: HD domain-containing protein [Planctomycetes bacterium]|nr:HD domain-containing protein [Planctomycetota bacterium]